MQILHNMSQRQLKDLYDVDYLRNVDHLYDLDDLDDVYGLDDLYDVYYVGICMICM